MTTTLTSNLTALAAPRCSRASTPAVPVPEALAVLAARTAVALETSLTRFLAAADQDPGHL